jgi:hypothetical protein
VISVKAEIRLTKRQAEKFKDLLDFAQILEEGAGEPQGVVFGQVRRSDSGKSVELHIAFIPWPWADRIQEVIGDAQNEGVV